jgi:hypothetical protein
MGRLYVLFLLIGFYLVSVSFSTDPPNGKTGAPGDSFCSECHVQPSSTLDGTLSVEGFPDAITPNQTYTLTVVNRNTMGDAIRGGFQMTILGPTNTRAGTMASPSNSAAVQMLSGRQYFEHHPAQNYPDSNVLRWTVQWTAPDLPDSSVVSYYVAGTICNGNFQNTGDRVRTAMGSGRVLISSDETINEQKPELYPNPGNDVLFVKTKSSLLPDGVVRFYNVAGFPSGEAKIQQGEISVPALAPGIYWLQMQIGTEMYTDRWVKI